MARIRKWWNQGYLSEMQTVIERLPGNTRRLPWPQMSGLSL